MLVVLGRAAEKLWLLIRFCLWSSWHPHGTLTFTKVPHREMLPSLGRGNMENPQVLGDQASLPPGQLFSRTETGFKGVLCPAQAAKGILHPIRDLPDLQ